MKNCSRRGAFGLPFLTLVGVSGGVSILQSIRKLEGQAMSTLQVQKPSRHVKNLTGQKFGRFIVASFLHVSRHGDAIWRCKCACGKEIAVRSSNLRSGNTSSCGCFRRDNMRKIAYRHGHAAGGSCSTEYSSWSSMKGRCHNKKDHAYKWYGGRGITVCDRWRNSFPNFLADMGRKPSPELSIDRINNDGNYEPENCRWATAKQQTANSRKRVFSSSEIIKAVELRRQGKTLKEVGKVFGVCWQTIWERTHKVMEQ